MLARTAATAAALTALLLMTGCGAASSDTPAPSSGVTPGGDETPTAQGGDEGTVGEGGAIGDITAEQLCTALQAIDVEALIGAVPYQYAPRATSAENNACLANADEDSVISGGISAYVVSGDDAQGYWQQFSAFDGVVPLDGFGDSAIYDEDLETGYLPVVTVAMLTGDVLTMMQFAPVLGAPVPPQEAATGTFVELLDVLGIPY